MQTGPGIQTVLVTNPPPQIPSQTLRFGEINHSFNILEIQLQGNSPIA